MSSNFKKKLQRYNATFFVIRGNHEERPSIVMKKNPFDWTMEKFWGNMVYVEKEFPFIKYALDFPAKYYIPLKGGKELKTLVLPGAYSVDKEYRLANNLSWFPQEQLTEMEMKIGSLAKSESWDLVLSHTCPICYEPTDLFLSYVNQSSVDKTMEKWLSDIEFELNYKLWCWGHFHATRIYHSSSDDKNQLMLFNNVVLNVNDYFDTKNLYFSMIGF